MALISLIAGFRLAIPSDSSSLASLLLGILRASLAPLTAALVLRLLVARLVMATSYYLYIILEAYRFGGKLRPSLRNADVLNLSLDLRTKAYKKVVAEHV